MKTLITSLSIMAFVFCGFPQNITNTLGTGGLFIIKDASNNYLTLDQSTGQMNILKTLRLENTANSNTGVIFKGSDRFIHNYGTDNIFIGRNSGNFTMTGYSNTAFGIGSLNSNTTGNYNTSNGYDALYLNTTGYSNTAIGTIALYSNTTGYDNTANGLRALYSNTIGHENTATGSNALMLNIAGNYNTANGFRALYSNTYGYDNTASGRDALYSNTSGYTNTAIGFNALYPNTTQSNNTAVGCSAGDIYTFSGGTFLGNFAYPDASDYSNVMGLGYISRPTASNQVRIGNTGVSSIGGYAGWTNLSDARYKTSVQENVSGLDFILKLRPITYKLDVNKLAADLGEDRRRDENGNIKIESLPEDIKARNEKSQIVYTGFIAQEVEKIAKEIGFDFSGIDAPKNEYDFYGLRYAEFVVPLVKAVQEQQKIIEGLTKRIEELEKK